MLLPQNPGASTAPEYRQFPDSGNLGIPVAPLRTQRHCVPLEFFRVTLCFSFSCCHRSPDYGILSVQHGVRN